MSEIFTENIIILYFFTIVLFLLSNRLNHKQYFTIIYLTTYFLVFLKYITFLEALGLVGIISFVFLEYLDDSVIKRKLIRHFFDKLLDWVIDLIFRYSIISFILSLVLISFYDVIDHGNGLNLYVLLFSLSIISYSIHKLFSKKIDFATFDDLHFKIELSKHINNFDKYLLKEHEVMLTMMEDKSFFKRTNSYNIISIVFLMDIVRRKSFNARLEAQSKSNSRVIRSLLVIHDLLRQLSIRRLRGTLTRGHSTLEMQLIRKMGVIRGYEYIFRRKILEIVYSYLFFNNLRIFYEDHYYSNYTKYKSFILGKYVENVDVVVGGRRFERFIDVFDKEVNKWSSEEFFVVCLGLRHFNVSDINVDHLMKVYSDIVSVFHLKKEKILIASYRK